MVVESSDDGRPEYHLFVSSITNNCSLAHWETNSRVDHAVSASPTQPFTLRDVAINTWAHNPQILRLDNQTWAIIHIGLGDGPRDGGDICSNNIPLHDYYSGRYYIQVSQKNTIFKIEVKSLTPCTTQHLHLLQQQVE